MTITRDDIAAIKQQDHVVQFKLELLDEYLLPITEVTADARDVTFNIDSQSDMRRTGSLTMIVTNQEWVSENFELGWMDKLVRFSIGILYNRDYRWYTLGTALVANDTFNYDATTNELQLGLTDIMAYLSQERGSQIGTAVKIPMDSVIKSTLEATIARWSHLKETDVAAFPDVVPYDLEFSEGSYPYDIMKTILELFPWYEHYFDVDGVYHADQIPMRISEPCILTADDINDLIISEKRSFDFSQVKNSTEIWGKRISADYIASSCQLHDNSYSIAFLVPIQTVEPNKKYCFTPNADSPESPTVTFTLQETETNPQTGQEEIKTTTETLNVYDSDGNQLAAGALVHGKAYVFRCIATTSSGDIVKALYLMGQKEIHVIVREMNVLPTAEEMELDKQRNDCDNIRYIVNPESPFACDRYTSTATRVRHTIQSGEIRQVLKDGDYASIYTTSLAYQRGEYENFLKCRMNTDTELTTLLIPFIDVNQKIEYTSPVTGETNQYIVKAVNMNVSGFTMTMKLSRFYNYYPFYDD